MTLLSQTHHLLVQQANVLRMFSQFTAKPMLSHRSVEVILISTVISETISKSIDSTKVNTYRFDSLFKHNVEPKYVESQYGTFGIGRYQDVEHPYYTNSLWNDLYG